MSIDTTKLKQFHKLLDKVIELQAECREIYEKVDTIQGHSREIFVQAITIMRETGLGDFEITELTREYLRNKIPKSSLNRYLSELKPELEESTSQSEPESDTTEESSTGQEEETSTPIAVTTGGSQTSIPTEPPTSEPEDEEPTEVDLLKIENEQLKDALHKTQQFTQASKLPDDDINTVKIRAGIGAIENLMRLEIPKLRNRGWKTVEITMRAV